MNNLKRVLSDMAKVEGITAIAIVGRDGFVIEDAGSSSSNADAIGAVISTGIGSAEMMGRELNVGEMTQSMLEFKDGIIVMNTLGHDAILAVVADTKANIGNIRYQIKKRIEQVEKAL